jgi:Putative zinc-finger
MMPIAGPATLSRRLARVLATARRVRRTLPIPPSPIDGDRLFAYWENTLDPDARREVEDQARSCAECRRWLEEIGKMFGTAAG